MRTPPTLPVASTPAWHRADISIRTASWALALACSAMAACNSTSVRTSSDAGDAGDAGDVDDASDCALPLDGAPPWGTCPATFDDTSWRAQVPCFVSVGLRETTCTGYLSRAFDIGGTHGFTCFYDPASKDLVAVQSYDDVPDLNDGCGNRMSIVTAGAVPPMGTCDAPKTLDNPCATADADATAGAGAPSVAGP